MTIPARRWRRRYPAWEGWRAWPWYVVMFATAIVLGQYQAQVTSIMVIWRPLLVFMAVGILLTFVAAIAARGIHRGAPVAAASLVLLRSGDPGRAVAGYVVVLTCLATLALILRRRRIPHPAAMLTVALNAFALLLLGVVLGAIVASGRVAEIVADWQQGGSIADLRARATETALRDPSRPDVYLIQLDGYPREDTLVRLFDYDNSDFIKSLESRGLVVATDSHSNYMYTELTMASLLNMRHIHDIPGIAAERDLRLKINHNPAFDALRARGYLVAATASGWESEAMRSADIFCGGSTIGDFELNLFGPTVVGRLIELAVPSLVADRDRASISTALDCITEVAEIRLDQPRFLYAHVPSPHLPIVFGRDGGAAAANLYGHTVQELPVTDEQFRRGYTAGLEYLNRRVLAAIDDIVRYAELPPIIVVFSDHGSESHLDWDNALLSDMSERFSNLFAAATPGVPGLFGDHPTPVNIFPVLLDHYFDATVALQPDDRFVSTVQDRLALSPAPALVPE